MEHLRTSLLSHIYAEDVSTLADPAIKALSVNEVLSFSHAIDHQLLSMKRGVLGSDIEEFVTHLLSTNLGGGAFPRSPTVKELQLCRRLARVEDDDIVTQLQILRMIDAFRQLTVTFQRALLGVMCSGMEVPGSQQRYTATSKQRQKIPVALAERIELNEDVSASASALTEGTMFSSMSDGMIPTYVLYQMVERYGLDARSWFRFHSAITLLPSNDDVVVTLRDLMEKEKSRIALKATVGGGSKQPGVDEGETNDDDHPIVSSLPPSPPGGSSPPGSRKISVGGPSSPSKVVPIEFISTSILTDTFMPLDEKVLRAFVGAFGAFDPNDPQNELGLSDSLVDGHLMLVLPIVQFAQVLNVAVPKAVKVLQGALDGVVHPNCQYPASGGGAGGGGGASGSTAAAARRRASRAAGGSGGISTSGSVHDHILSSSAGNQMFDEIDDVFSTGGFPSNLSLPTRKGSFQHRDPPGGGVTLPPARATSTKVSTGVDGGTAASADGNSGAAQQQQQPLYDAPGAFETLPQSFSHVVARGYLRFPEFELVIRYLNGNKTHSLERKKEEQQHLVDDIARHSQHPASGSAVVAPPQSVANAKHQAFQRKAPTSEEEQALIDEQAAYFEAMIFPTNLPTMGSIGQQDVKESSQRKQQVKIEAPHSGQAPPSCVSPVAAALSDNAAAALSLSEPQQGAVQPSQLHAASATYAPAATAAQPQRRSGAATVGSNNLNGAAASRRGIGGDGSQDAPLPLHGWPIHTHNAERLATKPYNGKDVERLRRSVMASPERSIQSYVSTKLSSVDDGHGNASSTNSKAIPSSLSAVRNAASTVNNAGGGAALLDGGGAGAGNNTSTLSPGGVGPVKKVAPISPRQRQLMAVLNMGVMQDILNAIPDEPMHLLNVDLRPKPGGGFSSLVVGSAVNANSAGPAGVVTTNTIGLGGGSSGMPPSLSLAALTQQQGHLETTGNGGASSITAGDAEMLESSFSTRGGRSATKHQASSSSYGRQSIAPTKTLGDLTSQSDDAAARSTLSLRSASMASQGRPRPCDEPPPGLASSFDKQHQDGTGGAPEAGDPRAGGAGTATVAATTEASSATNGTGSNVRRTDHHRHATKRPPDNGIHATAWRSVQYIPKLPAEGLGDYCNIAKRSGGGFGARGRPLPQLGTTTTTASPCNTKAHFDHAHADSIVVEPPPPQLTVESIRQGEEEAANLQNLQQNGADEQTGGTAAAAPQVHCVRNQGTTNHVKAPSRLRVVQSKHTSTKQSSRPPPHTTQARVADRNPERSDDDGNASPRLDSRPARPPPMALSPRRQLKSSLPQTSQQDPSVELRSGAAPQSARQPPTQQAGVVSGSNTARGGNASMQPAPPLHRATMGFMAVMDPTRHRNTGGSMLSFIPPALAADAMHSLNLRTTYPTGGSSGGRGSIRGSLLDPISGTTSNRLRQGNEGGGGEQQVADPVHNAVMAHSRQQMNKLRYA